MVHDLPTSEEFPGEFRAEPSPYLASSGWVWVIFEAQVDGERGVRGADLAYRAGGAAQAGLPQQ